MSFINTSKLTNDLRGTFPLFVTHVDGDGPLLKLSGQLEQLIPCTIRRLIESSRENLDKGTGAVAASSILEGIICLVKYKNKTYYRAKVISTTNLSTDLVGVHFIDYGKKDIIPVSTIRLLHNYDPWLWQLPGQAKDFYLCNIRSPTASWDDKTLVELRNELCFSMYAATVKATTCCLPIISAQVGGKNLSDHLAVNSYGVPVLISTQKMLADAVFSPMATNWQPNFSPENMPLFVNQNFPSNPAPAMKLQPIPVPHSGSFVPPSVTRSQTQHVNEVSRAPVTWRAPMHQLQLPQNTGYPVTTPTQVQIPGTSIKASYPKKATKIPKYRLLEENSQHKVFVSYAEEGPELFAVQLATEWTKLKDMMNNINTHPLQNLTEPPMIGTMCLGRRSDNIICRAIVMNLSGSECKLFFVDFGDTEMVSYHDIFVIPKEFVKPNVFAMRFCLSGVKNLKMGPHLNKAFKELVNGKVLTLRVVPPEGPPLIQYGELHIDSKIILHCLMPTVKETLQFRCMGMLTRGSNHSVHVTYIVSCLKFYVQLSDKLDELNAVMDSVQVHCERTSPPGQLPVGAACCARFPDDGKWYRAQIQSTIGSKIIVTYVDYGNEQEITSLDLRTITSDLIQLPAQAMKFALKDYEDKPAETVASNQLKMLVLDKALTAHIMAVLSGDRMLVTLVDETVSPPLNVARRMAQLLQPKSKLEVKAPTIARKDAPENFGSPEVPDGSRKKHQMPQDGSEDFVQRGGVFRGRDNKLNKQDEWLKRCHEKCQSNGRHSGERSERRDYQTRELRDNRGDRDERGKRGDRAPRSQRKLPSPVPLGTPFTEPSVDPNAQFEVSVSWITSPDSFYTQISALQPKFIKMMRKIPELYKGVEPFTGVIPVHSSVLAKFPKDGVLYRATVLSVEPLGKYIVQYVDFGNKLLVDGRDIWQLDEHLMKLPKMTVHCSLLGVAPKDGVWKANNEIDLCFNAPRYQCVFQECVEGKHRVSLWNNGASVADMLIEKELVIMSDLGSSITLKEEAIDLPIIIGQQILCRVTHVESFDKFYVQLDLDKALLVENAIATCDTNLLTPLEADILADGIHCTVSHQKRVYRAMLTVVSGASNINAVLVDYGMSITTALDKVMFLPRALSMYYYQALECCFNNYTDASKKLLTLDELKLRISDKKMIAYINHVDGIRLVTTLYELETGQKVAIFEPDEGARDEVVQLCTRAVFNYNFGMAYISHMESLNEIYLQKVADEYRIAVLLNEMFRFYEEGTPEELTNFEAHAICAAHSSDGNWYRATVISATETECKVHYPDYGNTETIAKESLKKLNTKFHEPCALALVAGLGLVALRDDAMTKLKKWTKEKKVQVTLSIGSDGWLLSLHLDGVDLSMKLVKLKLATPQVYENEELTAEASAEELVSLPAGCTQVYISHIDSPGQFWLQMSDKVDEIKKMQAELQANAGNYAEVENIEMGTLCLAKYLAKDQWYRAEILDSNSDITTVRFIDYGNTDVLDKQSGLLKVIPDHLKETERYAIKSSVNAVPTGTGQWSETASDYFTKLVGDLSTPVDAMIVLKDVTAYVDIFVNGRNLTDKLVSEISILELNLEDKPVTEELVGLCKEQPLSDIPAPAGQELQSTGKIYHLGSVKNFYFKWDSYTADPGNVMKRLINAPIFEWPPMLKICSFYAAFLAEDEQWYRAKILDICDMASHVQFIDYWNKAKWQILSQLPEDFGQIEPLADCYRLLMTDIIIYAKKCFGLDVAKGYTFQIEFVDTTKEHNISLKRLTITIENIGNVINFGKHVAAVKVSTEIVHELVKEPTESQIESFSGKINDTGLETVLNSTKVVAIRESAKSAKAEIEVTEVEATEKVESPTAEKADLTQKAIESIHAERVEAIPVGIETSVESDSPRAETDHLKSFLTDLIENLNSSNTVIENKSFAAYVDTLNTDTTQKTSDTANENIRSEWTDNENQSPEKDLSASTLNSSNVTIKTPPGRVDSNTDTGHTSCEHEKTPDEQTNKEMSPPILE